MTENEQHYEKLSASLEGIFLAALREANLNLSETVVCNVNSNNVEIGIAATGERAEKGYKMEFGSEVEIYKKIEDEWFAKENRISLASCGSFVPENIASYWRVVHAAEILKNWDAVCTAVNAVCQMRKDSNNALNL